MVPVASRLDRPLYPFLLLFLVPIVTGSITLLILLRLWLCHWGRLFLGTASGTDGLLTWCGESSSLPMVNVPNS